MKYSENFKEIISRDGWNALDQSEQTAIWCAYEKARENDLREQRLSSDKKLGYLQLFHYSRATIIASCIGVVGLIGVTIYNHVNAVKVDPEINKELLLMVRNIERNGIETQKTLQTDHKLVNKVVFRVNKLYFKEFPDQRLNAFGHYNKKGK